MKDKATGWYSILLGFSVIFLWIFILKPFSRAEGRLEMGFHLLSEFFMACLCIAGGVMVLKSNIKSSRLILLAHGMVMYSTANAAGYYGEMELWPMAVMFLILFSISLLIVLINLASAK